MELGIKYLQKIFYGLSLFLKSGLFRNVDNAFLPSVDYNFFHHFCLDLIIATFYY